MASSLTSAPLARLSEFPARGPSIAALSGTIDDHARARFRRDGVLRVRRVVNPALTTSLYASLAGAIAKFVPEAPREIAHGQWSMPLLSEVMGSLRERDPERFALLYDTVQTTVALQAFGTDSELGAVAAALLEDRREGLTATDHLLRMDAPADTRNALTWHQDSAYFRQNGCGDHGIVCWIPLHDVREEHGAVCVGLGSHRLGRVAVPGEKAGPTASEQYVLEDPARRGFATAPAVGDRGDAFFMHMDTVHRSGLNESGCFRWTAIVRFHRFVPDDFVPGRLVWRPSRVLDVERHADDERGSPADD